MGNMMMMMTLVVSVVPRGICRSFGLCLAVPELRQCTGCTNSSAAAAALHSGQTVGMVRPH
jgi:hypothetical protein